MLDPITRHIYKTSHHMELNKESVHRCAASVGPLVLPPSDVSGGASLEAAPETGGISTGGSGVSAPNGR